mgnify:CR=1 FL=1
MMLIFFSTCFLVSNSGDHDVENPNAKRIPGWCLACVFPIRHDMLLTYMLTV